AAAGARPDSFTSEAYHTATMPAIPPTARFGAPVRSDSASAVASKPITPTCQARLPAWKRGVRSPAASPTATTSSTSRTSQARCGNSTGNRGRRYPATGALAPIGYPGGRPPGYGAAAGPAAGGPEAEGGGVGPGAGGEGGGWLIEAPFSAER